MKSTKQTKVLRFREVVSQIGLSGSQLRRLEAAGSFPQKIRLGAHSIGYLEHEIEAFVDELSARRGKAKSETRA